MKIEPTTAFKYAIMVVKESNYEKSDAYLHK